MLSDPNILTYVNITERICFKTVFTRKCFIHSNLVKAWWWNYSQNLYARYTNTKQINNTTARRTMMTGYLKAKEARVLTNSRQQRIILNTEDLLYNSHHKIKVNSMCINTQGKWSVAGRVHLVWWRMAIMAFMITMTNVHEDDDICFKCFPPIVYFSSSVLPFRNFILYQLFPELVCDPILRRFFLVPPFQIKHWYSVLWAVEYVIA